MANKKKIARGVVLLVAIIAIGFGIWQWRSHNNEAPATHLTLYGNVDLRQVDLAFNDSERIASLDALEGDHVKKGQLLGTLDTDRLTYAVERAQAQAAAQQAVVQRLEAGTRPEDIRKARADLQAARVEADNAERNARRLERLHKQNLASRQQADDARANADAASAREDAARQALALAVAGPRKEDIVAAKATLKADQAQLALARRALHDARLYAPSAGIIRDRILEPGDMASPQRPVYTLALTNPMWVRTYVSEPDLGKIHPGMAAEVTTDSFPGTRYRGWIGYISPTAEFTPKSVETTEVRTHLVYQVRVFVCNPRDQLRLGMPATVTVKLPAAGAAATGAAPKPCNGD
ncbi:MAG: efflux RND transporter periplasmic adaptor subunit [Gammaproteobacteria bacterium]